MSKLNEVCGKLYAAEISTVNIDILKKEIRFDLIINDGQEKKSCILEKNVFQNVFQRSFIYYSSFQADKFMHGTIYNTFLQEKQINNSLKAP